MQPADPDRAPCTGKPCPCREVGSRPTGEGSLTQHRILGVVLAGGRSSRFGSDKASALFGGRPLMEHARAALAPHVDSVLIVGGRYGDIPDLPRADLGPLGGIAAGLDHAASNGYGSIMTIACDMPKVPAGLLESLASQPLSFCPGSPVLGHWPSALGAQVLAHIETAPNRSIRDWARSVGAVGIEATDRVININTPADLATL